MLNKFLLTRPSIFNFSQKMSFFTTKSQMSPEMLEQEMVFTNNSTRLNNMLSLCQEKCFTSEFGLTKSQNLCTDRCLKKFFRVAEMLEEMSKEKVEQMGGRF